MVFVTVDRLHINYYLNHFQIRLFNKCYNCIAASELLVEASSTTKRLSHDHQIKYCQGNFQGKSRQWESGGSYDALKCMYRIIHNSKSALKWHVKQPSSPNIMKCIAKCMNK